MGRVSDLLAATTVPRRHRVVIAVVAGLLLGAVTAQKNLGAPYPRDIGQVWFAARTLLHGVNPYPLVGPGLAYEWPYPLLYPLPAALLAIPLAPLSLFWASVVFMALGGAALAWALSAHGYGPLFGFFGGAVHFAAEVGQWSPLFAGALVLPWLGIAFVAKPTIGAAMFVARPSWWPIVWGGLLALVAFAIQPTWLTDWLAAVHTNTAAWAPYQPYLSPVTLPGGFLALVALLRWRRPEARLIAALACVPQTPALYEAVSLFLVPRTFGEAVLLVACSYGQHLTLTTLMPVRENHGAYLVLSGTLLVWWLYVPCVVMVLRRPNEGTRRRSTIRRLRERRSSLQG